VSDFDRAAKRVIPFWVFTSRNLPLQIEALVTRPQKFNRYLAAQRNIEGMSEDPNEIVPQYYNELGAIRLPFTMPFGSESTAYATPDLPFLRLNEDLSKLSDPTRLLSDANPLIKVAAEHVADKALFTNLPYKNKLEESPLWARGPLQYATDALGVTRDGLMTDKTQATIESLLPILGRSTRLTPTQDRYQDRLPSSALSFLGGASIRENTPSVQQGELLRRQSQLKKLLAELEQLGTIAPNR
jgi:hypothetical protein